MAVYRTAKEESKKILEAAVQAYAEYFVQETV